ncbi:MAG: hypothetical protein A4E28_00940 [Methanocella sp. PtaU1.Bin125]|nr:MAG: hypothetical protein A4E28_00940 [Methanocella sp. PtaU1.Bin125]
MNIRRKLLVAARPRARARAMSGLYLAMVAGGYYLITHHFFSSTDIFFLPHRRYAYNASL